MKKIINGKKYDTDTAKRIGAWDNGGGWRDFSHIEETLYRKKTGEYFLFGEGGPNSKYAEAFGENHWSSGTRIMPMTYDEARKWAEEHLSTDEYEAEFGAVVEDESKVSATFRLCAGTLENLRRSAGEAGMGISEYLESVLSR